MMQNKKIAITGGIGSGKSLLCKILKEKGYPVFSCDEISKELRKEAEFIALVKIAFPQCVVDGNLDEHALSEKIFSDNGARKSLELISHPFIMKRLYEEMAPHAVSFGEVPLLFEGGFEGAFDEVIVLLRDEEERIAAVMKRNGLSRDEVLSRVGSQYDYSRISEKKCIVIENDGSEEELKKKTEKVLAELHL